MQIIAVMCQCIARCNNSCKYPCYSAVFNSLVVRGAIFNNDSDPRRHIHIVCFYIFTFAKTCSYVLVCYGHVQISLLLNKVTPTPLQYLECKLLVALTFDWVCKKANHENLVFALNFLCLRICLVNYLLVK